MKIQKKKCERAKGFKQKHRRRKQKILKYLTEAATSVLF